ncbi:MAG: hypothetical protein FWD39_05425, partial [Clostridiales bacterium]|nr:hypothetical protein [Clostridiales bacterium]
MKTKKQALILMVLLLFAFAVLAAGCGNKLPVNSLCEDCDEYPCVCGIGSRDGVWVGAGIESDPLQVTKAAQLAEIARLVNAGELEETILDDPGGTVYIKLMNNIDLSGYTEGKGWTPIGKMVLIENDISWQDS